VARKKRDRNQKKTATNIRRVDSIAQATATKVAEVTSTIQADLLAPSDT